MKRLILTLGLGLALLTAPATAQGVLINELFLGVPDYCEIVNLSAAPVDIGGWSLIMTDDPTAVTTFVFPAGTILAPNQLAVVAENTSNPSVPAGTLRFDTSNINWSLSSGGTAALNDAANVGVDYVLFGNATNLPSGNPLAPFTGSVNNSANVLRRLNNTDTDTAADWAVQGNGTDTPGVLNPGQIPVALMPDVGQANQTLAELDINNGLNLNGQPAVVGINGPFFADGSTMVITVTGEPDQPWFLLLGPLNRNNAVFPNVGSLDIGLLGPSDFSDVQIVMNGLGPSFLDQFANTGPSGTSVVTLGLSPLPPGVIGTFQAIVYNSTSTVVGITAAFEYTVP